MTVGGNADLITIIQSHNVTKTAPVDNLGNTYLEAVSVFVGSTMFVSLFYCQAPTVSTTMTFTHGNNPGGFAGLAVSGYRGSSASPLLATNSNSSASAASLGTGSVTSGQLVVFGMGYAWPNTITASPGTVRQVAALNPGVTFAVGIGDIIGGAFGGLSSTWSTTGAAAGIGTVIASFKPSVAAGRNYAYIFG